MQTEYKVSAHESAKTISNIQILGIRLGIFLLAVKRARMNYDEDIKLQ